MEANNLIPALTKEFLEDALGCPIASFDVEIGSNPGDNYMSNLFAISVVTKSGSSEYLLLKTFPNHPARIDMLEKTNIFIKEVDVYTKLIPTLEEFESKIMGKGKLELPFSKFYSGQAINYETSDSKEGSVKSLKYTNMGNYLLFQDLRKTFQYKMADRIHGLDFYHCKLLMKELAKIHGLSWAYKQKTGLKYLRDQFPFLVDSMFGSVLDQDFESMQDPVINNTMALVKRCFPEDNAKEVGAVETFLKNSFKELGILFVHSDGIDEEVVENKLRVKPSSSEGFSTDPWLVGCHGDCWVNNFLFKYDQGTGKPIQLKLVDLQVVRESCPTIDLAYFFYSSTVAELRKNHLDELLQTYHDEFVRVNRLFGTSLLPSFNFQTLKRKYNRAKLFGFLMSLFLLPMVLTPPEQSRNLDHEEHDKGIGEVFTSLLTPDDSNTNLQGRMKEIVSELYSDGVI